MSTISRLWLSSGKKALYLSTRRGNVLSMDYAGGHVTYLYSFNSPHITLLRVHDEEEEEDDEEEEEDDDHEWVFNLI